MVSILTQFLQAVAFLLQLLLGHSPLPPSAPNQDTENPNQGTDNGEPPKTGTGHNPLHQQSNDNFSAIPPPSAPNQDTENPNQGTDNGEPPSTGTGHNPLHQQSNEKFAAILLCFTSALELVLQFFQLQTQHKNLPQFPLSFHLFSLAVTCAFITIFLDKFIVIPGTRFATLLRKIGLTLFAAAFILAIIIPSPLWLRIIVSAISFVAMVAAIFQNIANAHEIPEAI